MRDFIFLRRSWAGGLPSLPSWWGLRLAREGGSRRYTEIHLQYRWDMTNQVPWDSFAPSTATIWYKYVQINLRISSFWVPKKTTEKNLGKRGQGPSSVFSRLMESSKSWGCNENKSRPDISTYNMISHRSNDWMDKSWLNDVYFRNYHWNHPDMMTCHHFGSLCLDFLTTPDRLVHFWLSRVGNLDCRREEVRNDLRQRLKGKNAVVAPVSFFKSAFEVATSPSSSSGLGNLESPYR